MNRLKWNREFALEQAADDMELLCELLEIFKGSCSNDLKEIERGIEAGDSGRICSAAHSIKGASASLGIEAMRDIALLMEVDSRAGSTAVAEDKIAELKELLSLLQKIEI